MGVRKQVHPMLYELTSMQYHLLPIILEIREHTHFGHVRRTLAEKVQNLVYVFGKQALEYSTRPSLRQSLHEWSLPYTFTW
jgi:hypothetical protein